MKFQAILGLLYIISVRSRLVSCANWSYLRPDGPANWTSLFSTCGGQSQSPINIVTANAMVDRNLGAFNKTIFGTPPTTMKIKNNGHSLQVDMTGAWTISDTALLPGNYKAVQFHMHWGASATTGGSEHKLDGVKDFGELHIVHFNTKYPNISVAMNQSEGLAVLGFFIKADYPQDNLEFERLLGPVRNNTVTYLGNSTMISPTFAVETLLSCNLSVYYRYSGSLTTPKCFQSVVWTMFQDPIRISASQANFLSSHLRSPHPGTTHSKNINNNFRPVQPLNGRKVYKPAPCGYGSASTSQISLQLFSLCVIALSFFSII